MIWQVIVAIICWFVGALGFSQIIGVIKYPEMFLGAQIARIVIIWLIILAVVAIIPILIVNKLWIGVCIGYGISFLSSTRVTPD